MIDSTCTHMDTVEQLEKDGIAILPGFIQGETEVCGTSQNRASEDSEVSGPSE